MKPHKLVFGNKERKVPAKQREKKAKSKSGLNTMEIHIYIVDNL